MYSSTEVLSDAAGAQDATALAEASRGNSDALAALYDRHAPIMLNVASRLLGDREEAEDLLHDVFIEAWQRAEQYDPKRASVRAWLLVRTRSRALDRLRRRAAAALAAESQLAESVDVVTNREQCLPSDQREVARVLGRLSAEQRRVVELRYLMGFSGREIAESQGIPLGTVKSRLAGALAVMRAHMCPERTTS
ncbi:MAG: sigma-70 family RNA polymerase sigma factor [Gammaproteobacteria bacterium]|nr:sigma-70 family RNA polymerase sigma factor [Gammaproteobacteria bacterium]